MLQKNSGELAEDGADKRRNALELKKKKVISLQKKVRINCWLIKSVVTRGVLCVARQNGSTMSHVFCDRLLQGGTAQNISTRQHFRLLYALSYSATTHS